MSDKMQKPSTKLQKYDFSGLNDIGDWANRKFEDYDEVRKFRVNARYHGLILSIKHLAEQPIQNKVTMYLVEVVDKLVRPEK